METTYGIETTPSLDEGGQWYEIDPLDFITLVQYMPDANVEYDYNDQTFTIFVEDLDALDRFWKEIA